MLDYIKTLLTLLLFILIREILISTSMNNYFKDAPTEEVATDIVEQALQDCGVNNNLQQR